MSGVQNPLAYVKGNLWVHLWIYFWVGWRGECLQNLSLLHFVTDSKAVHRRGVIDVSSRRQLLGGRATVVPADPGLGPGGPTLGEGADVNLDNFLEKKR